MTRNEPMFLDVNEQYELCRFPDPNGQWSLRLKLPDNDRAHRRYLDELETQMVEAALNAPRSENRTQQVDESPPWTKVVDGLPKTGHDVWLILECGSELTHAVMQKDGDWCWKDIVLPADQAEYWRPM